MEACAYSRQRLLLGDKPNADFEFSAVDDLACNLFAGGDHEIKRIGKRRGVGGMQTRAGMGHLNDRARHLATPIIE